MVTVYGYLRPICGSVITVGLRLGLGFGLGLGLGLGFRLGFGIWFNLRIVIQTAGESDKMRINHVINTDQWRAALLHILSSPNFLTCST